MFIAEIKKVMQWFKYIPGRFLYNVLADIIFFAKQQLRNKLDKTRQN